ncbi:MAG TPA: bifunctional glutamate N-acetyltransferase/amino-acid acetyltransferase ArgJ [Burkholderiales bacterium]|nr:bifunctional glutamate N-acetyltransferase/amino-acid acetyltransferase ArgJ [Burkholderiales bacterium]
MAVNLQAPDPAQLLPVVGIELGVAQAGIRKPGRKDLLVMRLAPGTVVSGVFTKNRFAAAPVALAKAHLRHPVRALVVNTGNANAGTGRDGLRRALEVCKAVAAGLDCRAQGVLPFSTGVIMEPLPTERIVAGLPQALNDLRPDNWASAAEAIMTTDTVAKACSRRLRLASGEAVVTGIAKGSGMIRPDMATMLGFVATDAQVPATALRRITRQAADASFNAITVDGDTSTNDAFVCLATGKGPVAGSGKDLERLRTAITEVAQTLAQAIVRDGEGATKFVTVRVEGGRSVAECRKVAYAIAHSPLVKTAFFAGDPNLGRILAAIGNAGVAGLDTSRVDLYIDAVRVARGGGRDPAYREEAGVAAMQKPEFAVRVLLNRGRAAATVWTCDLSYDYVKINAEYRS